MPETGGEILCFRNVTLAVAPPAYDVGLADASLALRAGDLATVLLDPIRYRTPLPDLACGLIDPEAGEVSFLGKPWPRYFPSSAARHRGMIGRVYGGQAWVSNLNVDENVLLPHVHHRHGLAGELRDEAQRLAKHFGLAEVPSTRPVGTSFDDLKRAACVRAFLGKPALLILERPTYGVYPDLLGPLLAAIADARGRGAAVLWLDNFPQVFAGIEAAATARFQMNGDRMESAGTRV